MEDCETAVTCWVEEEAQVVPLCWMVKDTPGVTSSNLNTEISMTDDGLIKTTEAHLPTIPTNMPSGQNGRPRLVQLVRPVTLTVTGGVTRERKQEKVSVYVANETLNLSPGKQQLSGKDSWFKGYGEIKDEKEDLPVIR